MAITIVQSKGTITTGTTTNITFAAPVTAGNAIIVYAYEPTNALNVYSFSDGGSDTFTNIAGAGASFFTQQVGYVQNSVGGFTTVTATTTVSATTRFWAFEVSGLAPTGTFVDTSVTASNLTTSSPTTTTSAITTANTNELIMVFDGMGGSTTAVASPYTALPNNGGIAIPGAYYNPATTVTSSQAVFSTSSGNTHATSIVAFLPAPPPPVTGTMASTETADTMASSGTVINPVTGTMAASETADTMSSSGTVINPITGTMSATETNDTMSSSGVVANPVTGTMAATETNDSLVASGKVQIPALTAVGVQNFSITIASGQTQGTATINAVGPGAFILWDGENPSISNNPTESSARGTLTNPTTITATRNTGTAGTVVYKGCIIDGDTINLINSVQYGTVTLSSTSNTASISAVTNANAAVHLLGWSSTNTTLGADAEYPVLSLSGTTVTATRPTATGTLTVGFVVIEFQGSALNQSVQNVAATSSSSVTSYTATLGTAAVLANSMTIYAGCSIAVVTTNIAEAKQRGQLTGTTTLTVSVNTAVADAKKYNCSVVTFISSLLNSAVQRGTTTLTGATSGSTAITSVTPQFAALSFLGNTSTATTAVLDQAEGAVNLASAISVTTTKNTSTANITSSWEVVEFSLLATQALSAASFLKFSGNAAGSYAAYLSARSKTMFAANGVISVGGIIALAANAVFQMKASLAGKFSLPLSGSSNFQTKGNGLFKTFLAMFGKMTSTNSGRGNLIGSAALQGRASTQFKGQISGKFSLPLFGKTNSMLKGSGTIGGKAALLSIAKFLTTGKLQFQGRVALHGNVLTLTKGKAGISSALFLSAKSMFQAKARGMFTPTAALHAIVAFMTRGKLTGKFSLPLSGQMTLTSSGKGTLTPFLLLQGRLKMAVKGLGKLFLQIDSRPACVTLSNRATHRVDLSNNPGYGCDLSEPKIMECCNEDGSILIGTELPLTATFVDRTTGQLVDPADIVLKIELPDGSVVTPTPTQQSVGVWAYDYLFALAGVYVYRYEASGNFVAVNEKKITVRASLIPS